MQVTNNFFAAKLQLSGMQKVEDQRVEAVSSSSASTRPCSISCCRLVVHNSVVTTMAQSSAHGINRIITSKSASLKVMWTLVFLTFLGLFCSHAVTLLCRLKSANIVKTYEIDKVPFVFPDLYFCPSNPYSGSVPYSLNKSEADLINEDVDALDDAYSEILGDLRFYTPFNLSMIKAMYIQYSLPVRHMTKYLAQQAVQSVTRAQVDFSYRLSSKVNVTTVSHPENLVCFRIDIDSQQRSHLESTNLRLILELSTDPFFGEFTYMGYRINPILDPVTEEEFPFQLWSPSHGIRRLKNNGFKMLIVPRGAYPSLVYETQFRLSPGYSYEVKLRMEENVHSPDLHGVNCVSNPPKVAFMDHQTGARVVYNYSLAACYYRHISASLRQAANCTYSDRPVPWELARIPRCANMSEVRPRAMRSMNLVQVWQHLFRTETNTRHVCRRLQPCTFPRYAASSYSFDRWPVFGARLAVSYYLDEDKQAVLRRSGVRAPAANQVARIARVIKEGDNRSARLERMLNSYILESAIRVEILTDSPLSPQVLIAHSYSVTSFLADIGGLLGLYIGCSLLTVCELLELLYHLVRSAAKRSKRILGVNKQGGQDCQDQGAAASTMEAVEQNANYTMTAVDGDKEVTSKSI